jgi:outer membrane lipoprotein LolB
MVHACLNTASALRGAVFLLALSLSACASMDEPPAHAQLDLAQTQAPTSQAAANEPSLAIPSAMAPSTQQAPPPVTGQWEGRLSLKLGAFGPAPSSGSQMAFELDVKDGQGNLALATPLGTRMAMVRWRAAASGAAVEAQLETSEGKQNFASLEDLTQQLLGEALPLQAMLHWLQGHPAPGLPFDAGAGQNPSMPNTFTQAGWRVDASELSHGRLNAQREASVQQRSVTLRLRLDL